MPIIQTDLLDPAKPHPLSHQVYNGLDCCLTLEIFEELSRTHNYIPQIYDFTRAMQGPALEMMLRGFKIDSYERQKGQEMLRQSMEKLHGQLQLMAAAVWGKGLNPRSPVQLKDFFYKAMHLPEQWSSKKGVKSLSMDRDTLEKLDTYFYARPIIATILAYRDLAKELETLDSEIDSDGRLRTSYNIVGTETGRWSSSQSSTGTGMNTQNVKRKLRKMFVADPGWKLCGIDLEQAESREVGWICGTLFGDWSYLDACLSGDLHTLTCRLIWPKLSWTGDIKADKLVAEQIFYREFTYRDMSKRGGHGSNYYGTPFTMARHLKVPTSFMEEFQGNYFSAFPGIPKWHRWCAQQLQTTNSLTTVFGRERTFFGRPNDDTTLREAIAYSPQSATADRLNLALWRVWHYMKNVQIIAQVHDALYFLYREEEEETVVKQALSYISTPIFDPKSGRTYDVPGEAKIGWNWADWSESNPDGLAKFRGRDTRIRTSALDRIM
jgi:DNA polymerase-1